MRLSDAIARIRPSTVQVQAVAPDGSRAVLGSGFLVHQGRHVVTAKHVVDAINPADGHRLQAGLPGPDIDSEEVMIRMAFANFPAAIVDVAAQHDLALLELELPHPDAVTTDMGVWIDDRRYSTPTMPVQLHAGSVKEGAELAVSGFPLHHPSLVTTSGVLASTFAPVDLAKDSIRYLGDVTANPGNSGGPVYMLSDATVIGVCVSGRLAPILSSDGSPVGGLNSLAGLTEIVRAIDVRKFLERNGLEPERTRALPNLARSKKGKRR